ncbi:MAG: VOC family protein [Tetrasphaera sp.]
MITAVHALIYSDDAPATRAFFRDVLELPFVSDDESQDTDGWLIFATGPSEVGVHPTAGEHGGETFTAPKHHQVSFMVEDVEAAASRLRAKGATITTGPADLGFGIGIEVAVPGTDALLIYQPKHATTHHA